MAAGRTPSNRSYLCKVSANYDETMSLAAAIGVLLATMAAFSRIQSRLLRAGCGVMAGTIDYLLLDGAFGSGYESTLAFYEFYAEALLIWLIVGGVIAVPALAIRWLVRRRGTRQA